MAKYPIGYQSKSDAANGVIKCAVAFEDQLFIDIIAMAKREKKTFSEMVNDLCKCGKLCLYESDMLEVA